MLIFEVNWEFETIKFEMFEGDVDPKYNPTLYGKAPNELVNTLTEEMFISENLSPPLEKK